MRVSGCPSPTVILPIRTVLAIPLRGGRRFLPLLDRLGAKRDRFLGLLQRRLHESPEEGVAAVRFGLELRVELTAEEEGVAGDFEDLRQPLPGQVAADDHAGL